LDNTPHPPPPHIIIITPAHEKQPDLQQHDLSQEAAAATKNQVSKPLPQFRLTHPLPQLQNPGATMQKRLFHDTFFKP